MKPRTIASRLSESLHGHLNMYALAAGAAGVGMLAVAQPSEARIVYTSVNVSIGPRGSYNLDFNGDGITDVTIDQFGFEYHYVSHNALRARPGASDAAVGSATYDFDAALHRGAEIGSSRAFIGPGIMAASNYSHVHGHRFYFGQWVNLADGYLGVKFIIKGKTHFGWARFQNSSARGTTLKGYAYETISGRPIKAGQTKGPDDDFTSDPNFEDPNDPGPGAFLTAPVPQTAQPATLGMLALGAQGMPLWRRKEEAE
jgi:hypothetical protein